MNNEATELTAALAPTTLTDDPAVVEEISRTPYRVFVATIQRLAGNHAPAPGAPVLVKVRGLIRPIRLWMAQNGTIGADKPAILASESFADARAAVLQAQSPV